MSALGHLRTIFSREMSAYFNAAIAYIFMIVFVLLNGGLFMTQFFLVGRADMRVFFFTLPYLLCVFLPAVAMRLWAEERRGNTLELLLTFPMGPQELVLGKFLASLAFYAMALAGTLPIPLMLMMLGNPDMGAIFAAYTGALFLGAFFLALGIFISGFVRDQIVAFILTMLACFGLYLLGTQAIAASMDGWVPGAGTFLRLYAGTAVHFDSFVKGVIDGGDVLYFLTGTGLLLVLNGFWLEGRMRPKAGLFFAGAAALSLGIFLMVNWLIAGNVLGRYDMTEGKIYTLSKATQEILTELKAPVTAKLYISSPEKMPSEMKTLEQDIAGKLEELRVASDGKFQYRILHMEAANVVEEESEGGISPEKELQQRGIVPFQVQSIESDEVGVRLVYAAISLSYKEKPEEVIPRILPQSLNDLEYLLVSKIFRMTLAKAPVIAMVAPVEEAGVDPAMQALLAQLGSRAPQNYQNDEYRIVQMGLDYEGYDIRRISLDRDGGIPDDASTLVILSPQDLDERQRYEINRFLVSGGSVFLAVQNYEFDYEPVDGRLLIHGRAMNPGVNPLLESWGLGVEEAALGDARSEAVNVSGAAQLGPFAISVPVQLPVHPVITGESMNHDISITSRISSLFYLWGSPLKVDEHRLDELGLKHETLLSSSEESWKIPLPESPVPPRYFEEGEGAKGPFPLAVFVQGSFPDVFQGKPVPAWPGDDEGAGDEPEAVQPAEGKLILVGASSMFEMQLIQSGGHLKFLLNAVDVLTLGDRLVKIRSKEALDRSLGRISAGQKVFWRFLVTLAVPLVLALCGGFRLVLRRRAKQSSFAALTKAAL